MDKQEAFKLVYDELMQSDIKLFKGIYDAENGNKSFMYGVGMVLDYITSQVSGDCQDAFHTMFCDNLIESQERISPRSYTPASDGESSCATCGNRGTDVCEQENGEKYGYCGNWQKDPDVVKVTQGQATLVLKRAEGEAENETDN